MTKVAAEVTDSLSKLEVAAFRCKSIQSYVVFPLLDELSPALLEMESCLALRLAPLRLLIVKGLRFRIKYFLRNHTKEL